ncbi:MAG: hypothetical protein K0M45_03345 [Candidatus Paracaedibacteraceae bacterium]|nr:hypothetical protein [Candidatus Paracaedibacteraceae bacterium]
MEKDNDLPPEQPLERAFTGVQSREENNLFDQFRAAHVGESESQVALGLILITESNAANDPQKLEEGFYWLKRAADQGNEEAIDVLKNLRPQEHERVPLSFEYPDRVSQYDLEGNNPPDLYSTALELVLGSSSTTDSTFTSPQPVNLLEAIQQEMAFSMASYMVSSLPALFDPINASQKDEDDYGVQAQELLTNLVNCSQFSATASKLTDAWLSLSSSNPQLKSSEYRDMLMLVVSAAMQFRPQYFACLEGRTQISSNMLFNIGLKFFQEFTQEGSLDNWIEEIKSKVSEMDISDPSKRAALVEWVETVSKFLKWAGSKDVNDPFKSPLNKYVDSEVLKRAIELEEWLEKNKNHVEYNKNQREYDKLHKRITQSRDHAMQKGADYFFNILKIMQPEFESMQEMSEIQAYQKKEWKTQKRQEFEKYILESWLQPDIFESNPLRRFREHIARNQYSKIYHQMICESFDKSYESSTVHKILKQIWYALQLDTIHVKPQEASSRMPAASIDGLYAPNFGYKMLDSASYQKWINETPLATACGDIIVDAFHDIVDLGNSLDIDKFLERLGIFLNKKHFGELCPIVVFELSELEGKTFSESFKEFLEKEGQSSKNDNLILPFCEYLLKEVFHKKFSVDKTIVSQLREAVGSDEDLIIQAFKSLKEIREYVNDLDIRKEHRYDYFIYPFLKHLLKNKFDVKFRAEKHGTIANQLREISGSGEALLNIACEVLRQFKKFSSNMLALRPIRGETLQESDRFRGLVFGIGFNGNLFNSSNRSSREVDQIWLTFAESGRTEGGYILLSFLKHVAFRNSGALKSLGDNFNHILSKYTPLMLLHINKIIEGTQFLPDFHYQAEALAWRETQRNKFTNFRGELDHKNSFDDLSPELKEWIRRVSNWYHIPSKIKLKFPKEMPTEEYPVQEAARSLLFDAVAGRSFYREYPDLMPLLFMHWQKEIAQHFMSRNDQKKMSVILKAKDLDDIPKGFQQEVLCLLDQIILQVHSILKQAWQESLLAEFKNFMKPEEERLKSLLRDAKTTITNTNKILGGLKKSRKDVSDIIKAKEEELEDAQTQLDTARQEMDNLPQTFQTLSRDKYIEFKRTFFEKRNVSQCIEPLFARVLGHDRFFSVYLSKSLGTTQILQLGNLIPMSVIEPCDPRCQHHALGHLYVGDMLSSQSADRLDLIRRTHGKRQVPDRFRMLPNS